jgi:hypothetical protein
VTRFAWEWSQLEDRGIIRFPVGKMCGYAAAFISTCYYNRGRIATSTRAKTRFYGESSMGSTSVRRIVRSRYAVLRGATGRYGVLRGATRRYGALRDATRCYAMLRGVTGCYGDTRRYGALRDATRCYAVLRGATALRGVTGA